MKKFLDKLRNVLAIITAVLFAVIFVLIIVEIICMALLGLLPALDDRFCSNRCVLDACLWNVCNYIYKGSFADRLYQRHAASKGQAVFKRAYRPSGTDLLCDAGSLRC